MATLSTRTYVFAGTSFPAPPISPGLYVVATPIGNLRDITLRALETLAAADLVLCEDTRLSARLLDHYGIGGPRQALHEHNERERMDAIAEMVTGGKAIALISDAGTPLLSDPGFPLVRKMRERDLPVFAVPGPSALLSALTVCGLPTDRFSFIGFLPARAAARAEALAHLANRTETLVFYESPRRLGKALADMARELGRSRPAAVALELTKKFERLAQGPLGELATRFQSEETRGEAVVLVGGAPEGPTPIAEDWTETLRAALRDEPLRVAVDAVTEAYGLRRKEVYAAALALKAQD